MGIWWVLNNWVIPNYSEIVKEKSTKLKWKRQARINQHYQLPSYDLKKELEKSEEKLMILFCLIIFIFIYYSLFIKCYCYYYNNPLLVIFLGLVVYTGHDSKLMQVMSLICHYWLSEGTGLENIWLMVMIYGPSALRSILLDREPNVFLSSPT